MTPKQTVLKIAPDALCCFTGGGYEIRTWGAKGFHGQIGFGHTHQAAWADAAKALPPLQRLKRRLDKHIRSASTRSDTR